MFWWLLLLYPLVGIGLCVGLTVKCKKLGYIGAPLDGFDYFVLLVAWPVYVWLLNSEYIYYRDAAVLRKEKEYERLVERIRREPDPLLADWDREFNQLAGNEETVPEYWIEPKKLKIPVTYYRN